MDQRPDQGSPDVHSRRSALRTGLGLGLFAASLALGACGQKRTAANGRLGQPIPPDPNLASTRPVPSDVYRPVPTPGAPAGTSTPAGVTPLSRSSWTNAAPRRWLANRMGGISAITVHHDAISGQPRTQRDSASRLDSIRRSHLSNGWADIGYHFAIDPAGRVWACRPLDLQGAHVKNQNPHNLGIVVMGNFNQVALTGKARASLAALVRDQMARHRVPVSRVRTHQEMARTACPGRSLQAAMNQLRAPGGGIA